jgi:phage minor structural protein
MILFLYDNHENLISVQQAKGTISREINVFDELTASVPATKTTVDIFRRAMYIGVPIRGRTEFQLFKVEKADLNSNPLSITGIESAADDLAVHNIIIDQRFVDKKMSEILPAVFENTGWEYKQLAPDTDTATTNFYRISSKEALQKIESNFGVEVQFVYTPKGNQIAGKTCEIHKQIGTDSHLRLVQGVNVTEVKYTQDQTELYTAAIGRGSGLQDTDDQGEATGGYTRKIEFDDVVWSKSAGNPVDKPAGQKYVEIPEATEKYGWLDKDGKRKPRMVTFDFDNEKDVNKLIQETYDKLLPLSHPQVQIESTVAKIGQYAHLGDDVTAVVYKPYKLTYTARVIKMEDNPDDEEQSTSHYWLFNR